MPIYEYACGACGHAFEMLLPVGAPVPAACPACGEGEVRKLVSATSFVLKGGGWYKDGYGLNAGAAPGRGAADSAPGRGAADSAPGKGAADSAPGKGAADSAARAAAK